MRWDSGIGYGWVCRTVNDSIHNHTRILGEAMVLDYSKKLLTYSAGGNGLSQVRVRGKCLVEVEGLMLGVNHAAIFVFYCVFLYRLWQEYIVLHILTPPLELEMAVLVGGCLSVRKSQFINIVKHPSK